MRPHAGGITAGADLLLLLSIVGVSAPSFFVALLLQRAAIHWTQFTGKSLLPVGGFGWDAHIWLPALVLAARPLAQITRMTFISVSEVLAQDYIRTARGKGLQDSVTLVRHVLRNAAPPILTTAGVSLRFALSSLPVVELFFGWPGAGYMLIKGIAAGDAPLTVTLLVCFGIVFLMLNLALDLGYRLLDPRLRAAQSTMVQRTRRARFHVGVPAWLRSMVAGDQWRARGGPARMAAAGRMAHQLGRTGGARTRPGRTPAHRHGHAGHGRPAPDAAARRGRVGAVHRAAQPLHHARHGVRRRPVPDSSFRPGCRVSLGHRRAGPGHHEPGAGRGARP
ncbi:MAG: ABC transporter permease [Caldilineaceae bacterium]